MKENLMPPKFFKKIDKTISYYKDLVDSKKSIGELYLQGYVIYRWDKKRSYPLIAETMKSVGNLNNILKNLQEKKFYVVHKQLTSVGVPALSREIIKAFQYHLDYKDEKVFYTYSFLMEAEKILKSYEKFIKNKEIIKNFRQDNVSDWWDTKILSKIELMKHQKVGVMQQLYMDSFGLLWDPGTGKTATVIIAIQEKIKQGKIDKAFIFCPSVIRKQWKEEIKNFSIEGLFPTIIERKNINDLYDKKFNIFITTYESTLNFNKSYKRVINEKTQIVLDESTKIKNSSKRTRKILSYSTVTPHKIIMTGTIVSEKLLDVFYQIKFLDVGERLGITKESFIEKYFNKYGYKIEAKMQSQEAISDAIFDISSRFKREDVIDIPTASRRIISISMGENQQKMYGRVCTDIEVMLEGDGDPMKIEAQIKIVQILRLRQITSGFVGVSVINDKKEKEKDIVNFENPKLEILEELICESMESMIPTIIWIQWNHEAKLISDLLKKAKTSHGIITGKTKDDERNKICEDFMDSKILFLLANISTLQYGKNLQIGRRVIYFSPTYSWMSRKQSEDRVFRPGQKNKVEIISLVAKNTIDERIHEIVSKKKEMSRIINRDNVRDFI